MSGRTEKGNKSTGFPSENEKTEVLPKCVTNQKVTEAEKIEELVFLKKSGVSVLTLSNMRL